MGADMTIAVTKFTKTYEEALASLKQMDPASVLLVVDYWYSIEDETEALDKATECLKDVYGYYDRGSRDTVTILLDGTRWLISGGLSWGDDPTDAFRPIALVDDLKVTYDE